MNTKTISINRALIELKTLDSRIHKLISQTSFAAANKASAKSIGTKSIENFKSESKEQMNKILGLIKYRDSLKKEIVKSNAKTALTVAQVEMTVAEAIERKSSIALEKAYLSEILSQLSRAKREVESQKIKADNGLESFLKSTLGDDGTKDAALVDTLTANYYSTREYIVVAGMIDIEAYYRDYAEKLEQFEAEVDACLTDINAITQITVTVS